METCYNHMFIYAEFEIINVIFLRKTLKILAGVRSQYTTFSKLFMFILRFQFGHGNFGLKSWKSPGNPLVKMCKNPECMSALCLHNSDWVSMLCGEMRLQNFLPEFSKNYLTAGSLINPLSLSVLVQEV